MDEYEVDSKITGLRNWVVPVPGTTVTAYLGWFDAHPDRWVYSLWTGRNGEPGDTELISTDSLDFPADPVPITVTPLQVAKIAFLLDVEYADQ